MTADYELSRLPIAPVRAGTTLLVRGEGLAGVDTTVLRGVTPVDGSEGSLAVSTVDTGEALLEDWADAGLPDGAAAFVVDCVSRQQGRTPTDRRVAVASAPSDLTGIGMRTAECYEALFDAEVERARVGLLSISTLLLYADLGRVFRFVHTLDGRVGATDGLGLFAIDAGAHDERVLETFGQICDGTVEVRNGADGPECRVRGLDGQAPEWQPTP